MSASNEDTEVDLLYQNFWADIVAPDGIPDMELVKKELFDFHTLMQNISSVYDRVTGGIVSKPLTTPSVVLAIHDDLVTEAREEAVREFAQAHGIEVEGDELEDLR